MTSPSGPTPGPSLSVMAERDGCRCFCMLEPEDQGVCAHFGTAWVLCGSNWRDEDSGRITRNKWLLLWGEGVNPVAYQWRSFDSEADALAAFFEAERELLGRPSDD